MYIYSDNKNKNIYFLSFIFELFSISFDWSSSLG